jgi:hypothetical protein
MAARTRRRLLRPAVGVLLLGAVVVRVGPASVGRGLASVDLRTVAVALLATLVGTVASARRWVELARRAGLELSLPDAVRAYYRSQLLNAVLPSGLVGDVDRAVRHGRLHGRVGVAGRTVVLDRVAGQGATLLLTAVVVGAAGGPLGGRLGAAAPWVALTAFAGLAVAVLREPVLVATSLVAAVAHAVTFLAAASAVGVPGRSVALLAVALVVLAGGAVPLNVAGWGPREGVAAWAFGLVGLGAGVGVAAAVVHGVVTLAAVAPGLAFLSTHETDRSTRPARVESVGSGAAP